MPECPTAADQLAVPLASIAAILPLVHPPETAKLADNAVGEATARVVVSVCTYRRNESLDRLLCAIRRNAESVPSNVPVGVVVVDDNAHGEARSICDRHLDDYPLGLHYRRAGQANISIARNIGLHTALPISDWIAMIDDDCEPVDSWLSSFLTAQRETGADALTGPCYLEPGPGAPSWLTKQPFLNDGQLRFNDRETLSTAATHNSFVRSSFLRERPWLRFEPELGVIGGEDMVFFGRAHADGLDIRFSKPSIVVGHEPPQRSTLRHQIRSRFWLGNTEYVTNAYLGRAGRTRWLLLAVRRFIVAITRPARQMLGRRDPEFRYAAALVARAAGNASGALGIRVRHK